MDLNRAARNLRRQKSKYQSKKIIQDFTALVCDLYDLPPDYRSESSKDQPRYYFRPWKTMLVRTVADGGKSYYVSASHEKTIPVLWTFVSAAENHNPLK